MRYKIQTITAFVVLSAQLVGAQGLSPAAMELQKMRSLWMNSQNAAGMVYDRNVDYSSLSADYNLEQGTYHRPQTGEKEAAVNVSSEGYLNLDNALVWGSFNYQHRNLTDAAYNASITDPFRGMPYYVIDGYRSNWRNQYYELAFRASTPLLADRWTLGFEGGYDASLAAKQRDPRVDTRFYNLRLIPSVSYKINNHHILGLSLRYESIKEDSRMENKNSDLDQSYYILYGLGRYVQGVGSGRVGNYYGDKVGVALQYNFNAGAWNLMFESAYSLRSEIVEQSFTSPKKDAGVLDGLTDISLSAVRTGKKYSHFLSAGFGSRHIDGVQFISKYDNTESLNGWEVLHKNIRSTYDTRNLNLDYQLVRNRAEEYSWMLDLAVDYAKQDDKYFEPDLFEFTETLVTSLSFRKNFVLAKELSQRLLFDLNLTYKKNLGNDSVYKGWFIGGIPPVPAVLEMQDFNYMASNATRYGAALTYSQRLKKESDTHIFAKLSYDKMCTPDFSLGSRNYFLLSLGCNF